jgi:hypothetical protein
MTHEQAIRWFKDDFDINMNRVIGVKVPDEALDIAAEGVVLYTETVTKDPTRLHAFMTGMSVLLMNLAMADNDGAFLFRELE